MTVELRPLFNGRFCCLYIYPPMLHGMIHQPFIHVRVPKDPSAFLQDQISLTYMSPLSLFDTLQRLTRYDSYAITKIATTYDYYVGSTYSVSIFAPTN